MGRAGQLDIPGGFRCGPLGCCPHTNPSVRSGCQSVGRPPHFCSHTAAHSPQSARRGLVNQRPSRESVHSGERP